jgi:hypothetical protein
MTQVGKQSLNLKTKHGKKVKVKTGKIIEPVKRVLQLL